MGGEQAASVLATVEQGKRRIQGAEPMSAEEEATLKAPVLDKYEREGSCYHATARLWDDGIIRPSDTRRVLSLALAAAEGGREDGEKQNGNYGVYRM